jgi:hypothetical protein
MNTYKVDWIWTRMNTRLETRREAILENRQGTLLENECDLLNAVRRVLRLCASDTSHGTQ